MAVNFNEALKELKTSTKGHTFKKIRLINNDMVEGILLNVCADMIVIKNPDKGAGSSVYTIPISSILYISDCELI